MSLEKTQEKKTEKTSGTIESGKHDEKKEKEEEEEIELPSKYWRDEKFDLFKTT